MTGVSRHMPMRRIDSLAFQFWITFVMRAIYATETPGWMASERSRRAAEALRQRQIEPVSIASGQRLLAGCFRPANSLETPRAAVLLFHGIGDRLEYWQGVQFLLAQHGMASLVFHYSGYPGSGGAVTPQNLLADGVAAYAWLRDQVPAGTPIFLLGFSLGSGLAAEVGPQLQPAPAGVILCQAFTTLREAAARMIRPASFLARLLPDHWRTVEAVASLRMPLLIVHSDGDRLFPVRMAREIHTAAERRQGIETRMEVPSGHGHSAAYNHVPPDYWNPILDFIASRI